MPALRVSPWLQFSVGSVPNLGRLALPGKSSGEVREISTYHALVMASAIRRRHSGYSFPCYPNAFRGRYRVHRMASVGQQNGIALPPDSDRLNGEVQDIGNHNAVDFTFHPELDGQEFDSHEICD